MRWTAPALGLGAFAAALIAFAPATLVDARLERASDGRLRLAEAQGSVWSGAGWIEIRDAQGRARRQATRMARAARSLLRARLVAERARPGTRPFRSRSRFRASRLRTPASASRPRCLAWACPGLRREPHRRGAGGYPAPVCRRDRWTATRLCNGRGRLRLAPISLCNYECVQGRRPRRARGVVARSRGRCSSKQRHVVEWRCAELSGHRARPEHPRSSSPRSWPHAVERGAGRFGSARATQRSALVAMPANLAACTRLERNCGLMYASAQSVGCDSG